MSITVANSKFVKIRSTILATNIVTQTITIITTVIITAAIKIAIISTIGNIRKSKNFQMNVLSSSKKKETDTSKMSALSLLSQKRTSQHFQMCFVFYDAPGVLGDNPCNYRYN